MNNHLAAGMEEGWTEPEYQSRIDQLPPINESFAPKETEGINWGIIGGFVLALLAIGLLFSLFMEKREKARQ